MSRDPKHEDVIVRMTSYYDAGDPDGEPRKWKERWFATAATAATGLIQYLEWPGDPRRDRWGPTGRVAVPDATELGRFTVYRADEEATARLRAEMEKMDPAARLAPPTGSWRRQGTDKAFARALREAIKRATS